MQTTSAQWPGCFCKKMCRSNTCKKSHFVRKIHPAPNMLQKIALRAKNPSGPKYVKVEAYFLHEVQFSAAIEAAHFLDCETGY